MATILKCLLTVSNLTNGANSIAYGPPNGQSAAITGIMLTNKTAGAVTVSVGLRKSDNSSWLLQKVTVNGNARVAVKDQVTLSYINTTGDKLELWASAASAIDVVVSGMERDIGQ